MEDFEKAKLSFGGVSLSQADPSLIAACVGLFSTFQMSPQSLCQVGPSQVVACV